MTIEQLKETIRCVPDFPSKGIMFRDLTTLIKNGEALKDMGALLSDLYKGKGVTKVVGIDSRCFIGGSILAYELGCGFVPAWFVNKFQCLMMKEKKCIWINTL